MLELCRCPNIYGPDCIYIYIYICVCVCVCVYVYICVYYIRIGHPAFWELALSVPLSLTSYINKELDILIVTWFLFLLRFSG